MKQKLLFTLLIFFSISLTYVISRSFRPTEIPNGNTFSCDNCHVTPGGPRNDFGAEIEANFLSAPGSNGHVQWGPALAALDSDGDGVSNGVELQDPNGTWQTGDPAPGDPELVTNPGDPESFVPVELASFTTNISDNKVILAWKTVTETNNDGYFIERSADQEIWQQLAFVDGYGTTTEVQDYYFTDNFPVKGTSYYRLIQRDFDGTEKIYGPKEVNYTGVNTYSLAQNYPNPFNPTTKLSFNTAETGHVTLTVYNLTGEKVAELVNETLEAGYYSYDFNASGFASGIYLAKISAGEFTKTIKMTLIK